MCKKFSQFSSKIVFRATILLLAVMNDAQHYYYSAASCQHRCMADSNSHFDHEMNEMIEYRRCYEPEQSRRSVAEIPIHGWLSEIRSHHTGPSHTSKYFRSSFSSYNQAPTIWWY